MLRIDLVALPEGIHHLTLEAEAAELELEPEAFKDIHVDVVLDYRDDRALVSLHAAAVVTLECDRTLRLFEQAIEGDYQLLFAPPAFARGAGSDDDIEEIRVLDPSDRQLDLTDAVRDTLLLAIPTRKVAPGAEDLDLQTTYGVSAPKEGDPIDPRWEALRKLRSGGDSTES